MPAAHTEPSEIIVHRPTPDEARGALDSAIADSLEVAPGAVLDFNAAEQVVGIEMLNVSARSPDLNLNTLQFETT